MPNGGPNAEAYAAPRPAFHRWMQDVPRGRGYGRGGEVQGLYSGDPGR